MKKSWNEVAIGEIAKPISRPIDVLPGQTYRTIGVKWWGEGAYERETNDGSRTAARTLSRVCAGDLIINKIWVRHGSTAIASAAVDGCAASGEFPTFELDGNQVIPKWIHWQTKTRGFWTKCDALSRGTSGKNRIKPELFLTVRIPLPPLAEQRRVVARIEELSAQIHEARTLSQQAVDEAEAIVQARTTNLFDRLDHFDRVAIRTLGVSEENPVQTGPFGTQLHASEFVESGVPVLNVGNVWPSGLRFDRLDHVLPEKASQLSRYSLKSGDLLFARSGATLGKVCLVPDQCDGWLMTGHLFRVRFDESRINNRFAFAALRGARSIHEQVFGQVRGATRPGFNTTLLGNVKFPLPPLAEQRRIVAELDALQAEVDALKRLQAETAAELDALLPAILDRAFKGEL